MLDIWGRGVHHSLLRRGPGSSLAFTCIKSECPGHARGVRGFQMTGALSVAAVVSYFCFIGCLMAAKHKDSALASPSQSMMDIHSVDVYLLFVAFLFSYTMSSSVALHYRLHNQDIILTTGVVAICLAHWASGNTCLRCQLFCTW